MTGPADDVPSRLCAACGMCCDGTLFHNVTLQPGDSPRALASHGLRTKRRRDETFFHQPCPAHCGNHCAIYDDRPTRCRAFDCRLLQRVATNDITEADARAKITEARRQANEVENLIEQITETNPHRSLAHRAANALTTDTPTPTHSKLERALQTLETNLETNFRT